jgi:hypothetical protein
MTGSTLVARRAGMKQATSDTVVMTSAVPRRVATCRVGTSKRTLCIALPAHQAPIKPRMVPAARRRRPNEKNCAPICFVCAPSAMRMPISRVRCATA